MSKKLDENTKKYKDEVLLFISKLINEENYKYTNRINSISFELTKSKELIEILSFAHKENILLLDKIYKELNALYF